MKTTNKNINKIAEKFGKIKVYYGNTTFYVGVANFIMLMATFKKVYEFDLSVLILIPFGLLMATFIGWIDYKIIMKYQYQHMNKKNDIKTQLDRIEKRLDNMEKKQ